jgi:taurine dioxygenase
MEGRFFRDQHLDHVQHVAAVRRADDWSRVFGHLNDYREINSVANTGSPTKTILRGVTIPPYGGDTFWTKPNAAYLALSPTMRGFVDGLRGIHQLGSRGETNCNDEHKDRVRRRALESEHTIVTVHAETGERILYVSPSFLKSIVG